MPVAGRTLLKRVVEAAMKNSFIDEVIIATSHHGEDDPIEAYSKYLGVHCIRGDRTNVFQRFELASRDLCTEDQIVRITADNPFTRPELNAKLFESHIKAKYDYSAVKGLSHVVYEFIQVEAIMKVAATKIQLSLHDQEHVTPIFREGVISFKTQEIAPEVFKLDSYFDSLLTIDSHEDLSRIEEMILKLDLDCRGFDFDKIYHWLKSKY